MVSLFRINEVNNFMGGDGTSGTSGTTQNIEKSGYPEPQEKREGPGHGIAKKTDGADSYIGAKDHTVKMSDN